VQNPIPGADRHFHRIISARQREIEKLQAFYLPSQKKALQKMMQYSMMLQNGG
jgi:hypothetical protein